MVTENHRGEQSDAATVQRHSAPLKNADFGLVFNSSSHYTAAGR